MKRCRRVCRTLLLAGAAMLVSACAGKLQQSAGQGADAPQEILVTFEVPRLVPELYSGSQRAYRSGSVWDADLHTRSRVKQLASRYNLQLRDGWPVPALGLYCVAYVVPAAADVQQVMDALSRNRWVHRVQRNQQFHGMTGSTQGGAYNPPYNDPLFELQYGKHTRALMQLHGHSRGQNVKVGIIDSNVDDSHPDLHGQIVSQHHFVSRRASAAPLAPLAMMHGTAVAGVIAAAGGNKQGVVGIAPEAQVHVFGACDSSSHGTACDSFSIARAVQSAIDRRMHILNMSLAGPSDPLLRDLLSAARGLGMILIAADNSSVPEANFPADMPGVFSVGADLGYWFAPAEHLTTQAGGGYQLFRGTSIAAAGFTGIAALLRAHHSHSVTERDLARFAQGCHAAPGAQVIYDVRACR